MFPLIIVFFGYIASRALKIRTSGASIFATIFLSLITLPILTALFPVKVEAGWIVGLFMVSCCGVAIGWLKVFEPDSLERLAEKKLIENEHKKYKVVKKLILEKIKKAKIQKDDNAIIKLNNELKLNESDYRVFKSSYGLIHNFKKIFKKKSILK